MSCRLLMLNVAYILLKVHCITLIYLLSFYISILFVNRYAEFSGSMEGGESEAESDSGVAPSLASSHSEERSEPQPPAVGDEKRRSARRKE